MSRNACAQKVLKTVLQPMTKANYSLLSPHIYDSFEGYCYNIARRCLMFWASLIIQDDTFWHQYHEFFDKHRYSWGTLCYVSEGDVGHYATLNYETTDDPAKMNAQYLIFALEFGSFNMVEKVLGELSLEATLSLLVPVRIIGEYSILHEILNEPGLVTILDLFGAYSSYYSSVPYLNLRHSLPLRMELHKLLLFHVKAHYHEITCEESCVIVDLLNAGANANSSDSLLTPLQIVVQNWDYAGVEILLQHGADPNDIGKPGGYIPAHIDTTWALSSPLHILRNADYGFMTMEYYLELKVCPFCKISIPWFALLHHCFRQSSTIALIQGDTGSRIYSA